MNKFNMFITAVCVLFLIKLRWPKNKSIWKKSVLHPAQCMEYLGFVINSIEMKLFLPPGKMSQLTQDCKDLILEKSASVRTLSHIIEKLTLTMQAVLPAPLHYRHLQMLQVKKTRNAKTISSGGSTNCRLGMGDH